MRLIAKSMSGWGSSCFNGVLKFLVSFKNSKISLYYRNSCSCDFCPISFAAGCDWVVNCLQQGAVDGE